MIRGRKLTAFVVALAMVFASAVMLDPVSAASKPAKVKGVKITKVAQNSVTLKWKKAKRAKKYYIYKKTGSKFKKVKTVKTNKAVIGNLKPGKFYYIKVCGIRGKKKGNLSKAVKFKTLAKPKSPSADEDWYWLEGNNWYKALTSGNKTLINKCLKQMDEDYCASDNKDNPKMIAEALKWTWRTSIKIGSGQDLMPFKDKQIISHYNFDKTFKTIKSKYNITNKTPTIKIAALTAIGVCDKYDYGKGINQLVCAGYSNCYQYCMNRFGVPCYYISTEKGHGYSNEYGSGHAWNIVKINNKYYNVDVTWMDTKTDYDGKIVQRYNMCYKGNFLKSTKYIVEADESANDFMPGDLATHYLNPKLPIQCTDTSYDNYDWSKEYENVF